MPPDISPPHRRKLWGLAAVLLLVVAGVAGAALWLAEFGDEPPGRRGWFCDPTGLATAGDVHYAPPVELLDAPDGRALGWRVSDAGPAVLLCGKARLVIADRSVGVLARTLARLGLRRLEPPARWEALQTRVETRNGSTWIECTSDLDTLDASWHPAELAGVWTYDGGRRTPTRIDLGADGSVVPVGAPASSPCATWAAVDGEIVLSWRDERPSWWSSRLEVLSLHQDRRGATGGATRNWITLDRE